MLTIAICDNNPAVIGELTVLATQWLSSVEHRVFGFETKASLVQAMESGFIPDIAFLDILFGEDNGIELAKERFPVGSRTQVIFVTAYSVRSAEIYETEHIYILQKPVYPEEFKRAAEKAMERLQQMDRTRERYLILKSRETVERIPVNSIRYIESKGRKIEIHYRDEIYEQYASLAYIAGSLTEDFVQCHKSYYVNIACIRHIEPRCLVLDDGTEIPISQTRKKPTREAVNSYWMKNL